MKQKTNEEPGDNLPTLSTNPRENRDHPLGMPRGRPSIHGENRRDPTGSHNYDLRNNPLPKTSDQEDSQSEDDSQKPIDVGSEGASNPGLDFGVLRQIVASEKEKLQSDKNLAVPGNAQKPASGHGQKHKEDLGGREKHWSQYMPFNLGIIIGLLALILFYFFNPIIDNSTTSLDDESVRKNLIDNIRLVRNQFPSQMNDTWLLFFSGILKVLLEKPTEPSVFLLIHQDGDTTSCLARKVGEVAHNFLNATRPDPLVVDGATLGRDAAMAEDHGLLTTTYGPLVEEHRIMILDNLQSLPATLARGLHSFCDTVTPLVQKAVYIFTLNVDSGKDEGRASRVAERELNSLWRQLDMDILGPLVARITGGSVFRIQPEENVRNLC